MRYLEYILPTGIIESNVIKPMTLNAKEMRLPKYETEFNYFDFDLDKKSFPATDGAMLVTFIFC